MQRDRLDRLRDFAEEGTLEMEDAVDLIDAVLELKDLAKKSKDAIEQLMPGLANIPADIRVINEALIKLERELYSD